MCAASASEKTASKESKMKRIIEAIICAALLFSLASCAMTESTKPEAVISVLEEKAAIEIKGDDEEKEEAANEKTVNVHFYKDGKEKTLDLLVTDELLPLFDADWKKVSEKGSGDKVITFTIDVQHEVTFFDNGRAMIFCGYCSILEKDRIYYEIDLENGLESLYTYAEENGTEPISEDEKETEE